MADYKHIILAIDLHPKCDQTTFQKALTVAKEHNAKLTVVHAIEHINAYGVAQAYPTVLDIEAEMVKEAKQELEKLCQEKNIEPSNIIVKVGSPKLVILDVAKEENADLIILGSHGRHGINMLLGSTANAVLHHAECDVLAVRVQ